MLAQVLDDLAAHHPDLVVIVTHLDAGDAIPALVARDFDVVLSEHYPGDPPASTVGIRVLELRRDPLRLAISVSWQADSLAEMADRPWVLEPAGSAARRWATHVCRSAGFEPRVAVESADVYLHALLVERGRAAAFLPTLGVDVGESVRLLPIRATRSIRASARAGSEAHPAIGVVLAALRRAARGP